jgi:hypothetical protein
MKKAAQMKCRSVDVAEMLEVLQGYHGDTKLKWKKTGWCLRIKADGKEYEWYGSDKGELVMVMSGLIVANEIRYHVV